MALLAACGGGGFPDVGDIEEDLRERVASGLVGSRSAGEGSCVEDRVTADEVSYDCQVQVFALRPRDDQIVRFRALARSDGTWSARQVGVVTFDGSSRSDP